MLPVAKRSLTSACRVFDREDIQQGSSAFQKVRLHLRAHEDCFRAPPPCVNLADGVPHSCLFALSVRRNISALSRLNTGIEGESASSGIIHLCTATPTHAEKLNSGAAVARTWIVETRKAVHFYAPQRATTLRGRSSLLLCSKTRARFREDAVFSCSLDADPFGGRVVLPPRRFLHFVFLFPVSRGSCKRNARAVVMMPVDLVFPMKSLPEMFRPRFFFSSSFSLSLSRMVNLFSFLRIFGSGFLRRLIKNKTKQRRGSESYWTGSRQI